MSPATKLNADDRAVDMVRGIRDRQAKALAGKSAAEVIAFYRAAGKTATQEVISAVSDRRTSAKKVSRQSRQTRR